MSLPNGQGLLTWYYGGTYKGEWKNGVFQGKGKRIWHNAALNFHACLPCKIRIT